VTITVSFPVSFRETQSSVNKTDTLLNICFVRSSPALASCLSGSVNILCFSAFPRTAAKIHLGTRVALGRLAECLPLRLKERQLREVYRGQGSGFWSDTNQEMETLA
jgi:hypothetical protein